MRDALEGKVALVTGASRGIGTAIAQRFAAEGAKVALVARSLEPGSGGHLAGSLRETADAIAAGGGVALPLVADLSDPACDRAALVAQVEERLGPVDVLVNNAAACFYLTIDQTSERRLRVAYEVNVITPYLLTKAVVGPMRDRGAGWIVNITSGIVDTGTGTDLAESPQQARSSTYAPSKAALNRLTVSFATELQPDGIAVNALAPAKAVATEGATAMMDLPPEWLEPVEAMAEASLVLATCDPRDTSGLVVKSLPFLRERGREVATLDGRAVHT
jgi:NAD(P)-dependent dehydrogenase (short-subunit alcohol dehydrogenase family)